MPTKKRIIYIWNQHFRQKKAKFYSGNLTIIENVAGFYSTLFQYRLILPTEKNIFLRSKNLIQLKIIHLLFGKVDPETFSYIFQLGSTLPTEKIVIYIRDQFFRVKKEKFSFG